VQIGHNRIEELKVHLNWLLTNNSNLISRNIGGLDYMLKCGNCNINVRVKYVFGGPIKWGPFKFSRYNISWKYSYCVPFSYVIGVTCYHLHSA
jgi:hypothetical protein